ncbi:glycosyltransferase [Geminocystis sp. NIES-3709]|uniref:glycosyltransferase n=1 Tax=Geminocystis sp. NIES-3709 TaxID=1617448 RepID=UPI0005FC8326|nr:glycosyltransferase [Geminocystis sp. NIES-3709]BAQ66451.1 glycosyl transferase [Geminocystis sp. NIES-3709]
MKQNRILYIQYTNPAGYPPLEHSSQILAKEGWKILFLGTGASGADALKFPAHPNITIYQIPFCEAGWRQKLHYIRFCFWIFISVLRWQPQWIYASDILICPIAYLLTFFPQVKVIYHEHDSPTTTSDSLFINWCLQARVKLAYRAKFCILPNQDRVNKFALETTTDKQIFCVWNCPRRQEVSDTDSFTQKNELWLWYHGSIVPSQLPMTVIKAMAKLQKNIKLRIAGYETIGHQGYVQELQTLANTMGIGDRIQYVGTFSQRSELLESCSKCDIGLSLFIKPTMQPMTGASNKPFDYLACGLPLIVSDLPDWQQMYVKTGYGLACNPEDIDSVVKTIQWYSQHPLETKTMGEKGQQKILDEWNYETQFELVKNQL